MDQAAADARYVNIDGDTMTAQAMLALSNANAASISSTNHPFQVGPTSALNMRFAPARILTASNGALSQLNLEASTVWIINGSGGLLQFEALLGQKLNFWGAGYGIGVQTNCEYLRSPNSFAFYIGGSHSDTKFDAGGGLRGPVIDNQGWILLGKTAGGAVGVVGMELQSNGVHVSTVNGAGLINQYQSKIGGSNVAGEVYTRFSTTATPITAGEIKLAAGPTVTYGTTSDRRMKRIIAPVEGATERVKQLRVWHFAWKHDDAVQDGFMADEVQEVVPEAVSGEPDAVDGDGAVVPQQLDQARLVPLLTAALQEALDRIDTLELRVQALEAA